MFAPSPSTFLVALNSFFYPGFYYKSCLSLKLFSLHLKYRLSIAMNILPRVRFFLLKSSFPFYTSDWISFFYFNLSYIFLDIYLASLLIVKINRLSYFSSFNDFFLRASWSVYIFWRASIKSLFDFFNVMYLLSMSIISGYWSM